ncbi:mycothiol system anti-sigma-R factor [Brachybacterium fresconis]|uniref:Mycothiol system anti-sigma-R factor n=1 Tax=Brachybacterium fresconis TaxID=173363 RepID=A0ABS4YGY9_9MICO|nr:mycothiol system anti-sigma-R factor [Brachybacterium fresconis]MBP2408067.1 mycothiol system anti-sigma-R factor [Brachybacterium fresconis]
MTQEQIPERDPRYGLEEALDGELPQETVERMQRHTADCPECAEEWERVRRIKELVRRSCADQAPSGLRERIAVQYRSVSVTRTTDADGSTSVRISSRSARREIPGT